jgi:oligosaccharide repeat unit polymerase
MSFLVSPWLPLGVLVGLSLIAHKLQGSWLAPSVSSGLLWSIFIALPLLLNRDSISGRAVWLICGLVTSFQIGAFMFELPCPRRQFERRIDAEGHSELEKKCLQLSLLFSAVGMIGGIWYVSIWMRSLGMVFSVEDFMSLGSQMYGVLLQGEDDPWWFRLLRMWLFPAALLGGFACALTTSRLRKFMSLCAFIPALLVGMAIASRYGITLEVVCWLAGYFSMKCYLTAGRYRWGGRLLASTTLTLLSLVGMYVGLGVVRGHKYEDVSEVSEMVRSNLVGYLAVFDDWVQTEKSAGSTFGAGTVAGVAELAGVGKRARALDYEEVILENGVWSNVFTAFRGLLEDFSLPGALVLCLVLGTLVGRAYTRSCIGLTSGVWVLAAFYVYVLWSPIVSAFNYNAVILAILAGAVTLRSAVPRSLGHKAVPALQK